MLKPAASILGSGWILSCAVQEWPELCRPRHLLTSPGIYAFPAGLIALTAVSSPRAAPEWFFLLCLCFAALGLLLAFLTEADLAITVRRYRAEAISFEEAAQGMARAARAMFRAAQMVAIALAIGVGAGLALAFPGLAILAAMLTPVLAIAIAALPGAVAVPRLADAALALVVPVNALSPGADGEDRFRMGWRFEARMGAVRAALADRSAPLPSEARDLIKALDGGGMVRPPITQLSVVSVAGLRLRARGLKGAVVTAFPVALFVWLVAALMPSGVLSALPRPGDLWQLPSPFDATLPDPVSAEDHTEGNGIPGPGPDDAVDDGSAEGGEAGESDGLTADDAARDAGGSAADAGSGSEGEVPSGGIGESGHGQSLRDGESASGEAGDAVGTGTDGAGSDGAGRDGASEASGDAGSAPQGGSPGADATSAESAGQDGASQAGGNAGSATEGGGHQGGGVASAGVRQGASEGAGGATEGPGDAGTADAGDGAGGAEDVPNTGGDLGSGAGNDSVTPTGAQGPDGSPGGDSVSGPLPSGSDGPAGGPALPEPLGRGGASGELPAEIPLDASETQPGKPNAPASAEDGRTVLASGTRDGTEQGGVASADPALGGGDTLSIGAPPSLFAEPGAAPPTVLRDLTPETVSGLPPGPAIPPSQRLPAWIADLFQ